jgi:chaperonin GroEL (HSP60 family)
MLMATAVSQLAEKTPGKESVAIESFARALRQVIEQIFLLINHFFCCCC